MNLIEVFKQFPTHQDCLKHLEKVRWNNTPSCPYCKSTRVSAMPKEHRHHCNACNTSFSVTVGTIFHRTRLDLQKWFLAVSLVLDAKKGLSSRQLSRHLKVNKDTAWRMSMQIRKAMNEADQRELLTGVVEMDEHFVGGKPRRGSKNDPPAIRGRGTKKIPVVGILERGGKVRAKVTDKYKLKGRNLRALVRQNVDVENTVLMTDEYKGYINMSTIIDHRVINHQDWYVCGDIHTNGIESFWSLLKRGVVGQYHKVSRRHLPAYINEFTYRHNHRGQSNLFGLTILRAVGGAS